MRIGRETKRGLRQARKLLHLCLPISGNSSAESEWGPWGEAYRLVRTPDSRGVYCSGQRECRRGSATDSEGKTQGGERDAESGRRGEGEKVGGEIGG